MPEAEAGRGAPEAGVDSARRWAVRQSLGRRRPCPSALEVPIAADRYVTEVTRRRLLKGLGWLRGTVTGGPREFLTPEHTFWSGALPEADFLARLYDLDELPSTDPPGLHSVPGHRPAPRDERGLGR
jgi:hypothetical protein